MTSEIPQGTMFIKKPYEFESNPTARVFVKTNEFNAYGKVYSRFVDNKALVIFSAFERQPSWTDELNLSDTYYKQQVEKGEFIPIDDLKKVEEICKARGFNPPPPVDLDAEFLRFGTK